MVPLASRTDAFSPVPPMSIASVVGLVPEDPVVGPVAEDPDEPAGCSFMCSLPPPVDGSTRSVARAAGRRSGRSSLSDGRPRGPPPCRHGSSHGTGSDRARGGLVEVAPPWTGRWTAEAEEARGG